MQLLVLGKKNVLIEFCVNQVTLNTDFIVVRVKRGMGTLSNCMQVIFESNSFMLTKELVNVSVVSFLMFSCSKYHLVGPKCAMKA